MTIAERAVLCRFDRRHRRPGRLHLRHRARESRRRRRALDALTGADVLQAARTYLRRPTVIGHLEPERQAAAGQFGKEQRRSERRFLQARSERPHRGTGLDRTRRRNADDRAQHAVAVEFTLSNGVRVIVQEKTDHPTFVLRGRIASSPAFEPLGQEGIIRLASSVADYGSAKYPFAQRHAQTDEMGAFVNTGQSFSARAETRDFERVVAILADGEAHPAFADPWLSVERSQLANSLLSESHISGVMIDRAYRRCCSRTTIRRCAIPRRQALTASRAPICSTTRVLLAARPHHDCNRRRYGAATRARRAGSGVRFVGGDGPKPDAHLMAMPPATSGHDYIGTEANQVYIRLGQPAPRKIERRLRCVFSAQPNPRRQRRIRIASMARTAPKTRPRLQRQQLAGFRRRPRRFAHRAQRVAAAGRRGGRARARATAPTPKAAGLGDRVARGQSAPGRRRAARRSFVVRPSAATARHRHQSSAVRLLPHAQRTFRAHHRCRHATRRQAVSPSRSSSKSTPARPDRGRRNRCDRNRQSGDRRDARTHRVDGPRADRREAGYRRARRRNVA